MRIAVVGAGAMGAIFGSRFAQAGHDTVVVDVAEPLVDKINADGIAIVRGDDETVTKVPATTDPASVGEVDLVVFCVKCYHTSSAAQAARPLVGSDTVVASLQNGWGNGDVLASVYPAEQVVVGVTYNSGTVLDVGRVAHPGVGPTTVGSFADGGKGRPEQLAGALGDAGFEASVAAPIRPEIWKKLVLNAATLPASALTGMNAGQATAQPDDERARVGHGARGGRGRPRARLRHRREGAPRHDPRLARARRPDERIDAAGLRGRTAHRDRRDQRRRRARGRRERRPGADQPHLRPAREGLGVRERARMSTRLTYFGAAGYEIVGPSTRILMDPFLSENPLAPCSPDELEPPDVILVSHAAFDHYGDTASIARRTGAPVVCDTAVRAMLIDEGVSPDQVSATTWGIVVEVAGLQIRPVECHHWSSATLSDGRQAVGNPIAFIVETEPGVRIYHYGDTCIFDMRLIGELYKPTVGLLGCTLPKELSHRIPGPATFLTGEMDADEAARTAEMLGVDLAVACHYLAPDEEVERFLELVPVYDTTGRRRAVAPLVGETLVVDGDRHSIEETVA